MRELNFLCEISRFAAPLGRWAARALYSLLMLIITDSRALYIFLLFYFGGVWEGAAAFPPPSSIPLSFLPRAPREMPFKFSFYVTINNSQASGGGGGGAGTACGSLFFVESR